MAVEPSRSTSPGGFKRSPVRTLTASNGQMTGPTTAISKNTRSGTAPISNRRIRRL
jgi:hypothetical protein